MATKKKDNNKPNLRRRARRDVMLAIDPVLDQIRRANQGAENDYESAQNQVGQIYAGLQNQLQPLGGQYDDQAARIQSDLTSQLGGLTSLLGSSVPTENAAATQMFGTMGAGAQTLLANDRSRNLGYQTSTQRQAGLDRQGLESRFLQEYRDLLDDLRQQRLDVMGDVPTQISARLDALRQQRTQNRLAQSELELRESIANKQIDQQNKDRRATNRSENRAYNAAEEVVEDEKSRKQLGRQIRNINQNVLPGLTSQIQQMREDYPNEYRQGKMWYYDSPQGDQVPIPQLADLTQKRRRKRRKVKKLKRRRRNL